MWSIHASAFTSQSTVSLGSKDAKVILHDYHFSSSFLQDQFWLEGVVVGVVVAQAGCSPWLGGGPGDAARAARLPPDAPPPPWRALQGMVSSKIGADLPALPAQSRAAVDEFILLPPLRGGFGGSPPGGGGASGAGPAGAACAHCGVALACADVPPPKHTPTRVPGAGAHGEEYDFTRSMGDNKGTASGPGEFACRASWPAPATL